MTYFIFDFITAESVRSFLVNLTSITQSAEETFVVLSTFISTGLGGVLIAIKQVKKRMNSAEGTTPVPNVTQEQLAHIEELLKQEHIDFETFQKTLDGRCTTLENDVTALKNDRSKTPKQGS